MDKTITIDVSYCVWVGVFSSDCSIVDAGRQDLVLSLSFVFENFHRLLENYVLIQAPM